MVTAAFLRQRWRLLSIDVAGEDEYSQNTVADLTGIEYFTKLNFLYCDYNQITSLDISKNTELIELSCGGNQLTSLNVSNNTLLENLQCYDNQIKSLDVSKNTALVELWCNNNKLTSLNVSNNTQLIQLICNYNQITSLDVSNNTQIKKLVCGNNQLKSLDLSKNTELIILWCNDNQLTSLNVSNNTKLKQLLGNNNQFTSFDVSNNTVLTELSCYYNSYSIGKINDSYSLNNLPKGFDPAKASNWTGATYDPATNSLKNFTSDTITYTYNCGNGKTATFTLKCTFSNAKMSNVKVNSDNVVVTYTDNTSETYSFDNVTEAIVDYMAENDFNQCIDFVNAFSAGNETLIITDAQLSAIDAVLEYDYAV